MKEKIVLSLFLILSALGCSNNLESNSATGSTNDNPTKNVTNPNMEGEDFTGFWKLEALVCYNVNTDTETKRLDLSGEPHSETLIIIENSLRIERTGSDSVDSGSSCQSTTLGQVAILLEQPENSNQSPGFIQISETTNTTSTTSGTCKTSINYQEVPGELTASKYETDVIDQQNTPAKSLDIIRKPNKLWINNGVFVIPNDPDVFCFLEYNLQ